LCIGKQKLKQKIVPRIVMLKLYHFKRVPWPSGFMKNVSRFNCSIFLETLR
jgi:hypothetical protein